MESRKQERPCWGGKPTLREGEEASRCDRKREGGREKQVRRTQVGKQGRKWGIIITKDLWEIWLGNYL